eukprot:scaffold94276_cov57-Phaeocystis_antarctica.AAC.12
MTLGTKAKSSIGADGSAGACTVGFSTRAWNSAGVITLGTKFGSSMTLGTKAKSSIGADGSVCAGGLSTRAWYSAGVSPRAAAGVTAEGAPPPAFFFLAALAALAAALRFSARPIMLGVGTRRPAVATNTVRTSSTRIVASCRRDEV